MTSSHLRSVAAILVLMFVGSVLEGDAGVATQPGAATQPWVQTIVAEVERAEGLDRVYVGTALAMLGAAEAHNAVQREAGLKEGGRAEEVVRRTHAWMLKRFKPFGEASIGELALQGYVVRQMVERESSGAFLKVLVPMLGNRDAEAELGGAMLTFADVCRIERVGNKLLMPALMPYLRLHPIPADASDGQRGLLERMRHAGLEEAVETMLDARDERGRKAFWDDYRRWRAVAAFLEHARWETLPVGNDEAGEAVKTQAAEKLRWMAEHEEWVIRWHAAWFMYDTWWLAEAEVLETLTHDPSPQVREAAGYVVARVEEQKRRSEKKPR